MTLGLFITPAKQKKIASVTPRKVIQLTASVAAWRAGSKYSEFLGGQKPGCLCVHVSEGREVGNAMI